MKNSIGILLLVFLTGCGMAEDLNRRCGGFMDHACNFVFGMDEDERDDLDERVTDLEQRVELLQEAMQQGTDRDTGLQEEIYRIQSELVQSDRELLDRLMAAELDINGNQNEIDSIRAQLSSDLISIYNQLIYLRDLTDQNEAQLVSLAQRLASIEQNESISQIVDPCGSSPGIDEVLFIMSSGKVVAWYKDLGLSVLSNGTYITTDSQQCSFTVYNGNVYQNIQ